jgi:hypothetical protein
MRLNRRLRLGNGDRLRLKAFFLILSSGAIGYVRPFLAEWPRQVHSPGLPHRKNGLAFGSWRNCQSKEHDHGLIEAQHILISQASEACAQL